MDAFSALQKASEVCLLRCANHLFLIKNGMPKKRISFFHKRALITGASSGLGATFAEMLKSESVAAHGT